jgi:biopolymer transport protein ExbB
MNVEQTMIGVFSKMGPLGQIIALLIFFLSIVSVFVFIERLLFLKFAGKSDPHFIEKIKENISEGNISAAKDYCNRSNTALSRVILKGLNRIGMPIRDIELAMDKQIGLEIFKFEKGEGVLSLISKLAPMLGFIGTIGGVIQIFYTINATGDYNIESISGGLYVKMITSALGLFLGILAYFFYFVVSSKIKNAIYTLDKGTSEFIDIISSPSKG